MSIYDISGSEILNSYNNGGVRVESVYDVNGVIKYTGDDIINMFETIPMRAGWKFNLVSSVANASYTSTDEAQPEYNDSSWTSVSVPHDWSIEQSFNSKSPGGFAGGFLNGGDAWYRTIIPVTAEMIGKRLFLYFDGVYMESKIYVNGTLLGKNKNGYAPFWIEITDNIDLTEGTDNILAVFVRNRQPSSRWYSGSGIYRDVSLVVCQNTLATINNIIISTPYLSSEVGGDVTTNARVDITSTVAYTVNISLEILYGNTVVASSGSSIAIAAGSNSITISTVVFNPTLWGIGQGNLYTARVTLKMNGVSIYRCVEFGYRYTEFNTSTGFWLNGQNIKIKGVSMHSTHGCLGSIANASGIERELDVLVEMGVNAIRTVHCPESAVMLDLCAHKGILVFEEFFDTWTVAKVTYDFARFYSNYYDTVISNTLRRDVNNPAIILWGIGNEIPSSYSAEEVNRIAQASISVIRGYDAYRPITMGDNHPNTEASDAWSALLDVIGINYGVTGTYNTMQTKFPNKPLFGSETTSAYMIRGDYTDDKSSNYDGKVTWGTHPSVALHQHMDDVRLAGMFPWCGVDYLGEPAPYKKYPQRSCADGALDTALFKKDVFYLYQSVWTDEPMIHIIPMNWDWEDGETVLVWLYSNCSSVKLFLNGTDLGSVEMGNKYQYSYDVTYEAGTLEAKGYDSNGNVIAEDSVTTSTGTPTQLALTAESESVDVSSDDLVFVTCVIKDANGVMVPTANNSVTFSVDGGSVLGTDSGWVMDVEDMRGSTKMASFGKLLCVAKHDGSKGTMTITATSSGLASASVTVNKV